MSLDLLHSHLSRLEVARTHAAEGMTVHFLRLRCAQPERGLLYRTLEEALAANAAEVTERPGTARVGTLALTNRSAERIFLLGGEVLRGGKQDRMVNTDVLVDAGSQVEIPVSCVERGRWTHISPGFQPGSTATPTMRCVLSESVTRSYIAGGTPTSNQGSVWHEVDTAAASLGTHSPTSNLSEHYHARAQDLRRVVAALAPPGDACGLLVQFPDGRSALDVFDRADTFRRYVGRLLEGYAADAIACGRGRTGAAGVPTPAPDPSASAVPPAPHTLLAGVTGTEHAGVGLGTEVRLSSARVRGNALVVAATPVHASIFSG